MPCQSEYVAGGGAQSPIDSFHDAIGDSPVYAESDCDNQFFCWIKEHPLAAVAIALALGLLIGRR